MSKYSRTRKAICRVSKLKYWIVSRRLFKRYRIETWKQSYKKYRKNCLLNKQNGIETAAYSYLTGNSVFPPCKYKEALELFDMWKLPM